MNRESPQAVQKRAARAMRIGLARCDMTAADLAKEIDRHPSQVSRYMKEGGTIVPDVLVLLIVKALGHRIRPYDLRSDLYLRDWVIG
jgi:hypothetical protein